MRYLVTGALGAIGAWTVRALLDRGHDVVTFDLGGSDHRLRLAVSDDELAGLTRVQGDVTDLEQLQILHVPLDACEPGQLVVAHREPQPVVAAAEVERDDVVPAV